MVWFKILIFLSLYNEIFKDVGEVGNILFHMKKHTYREMVTWPRIHSK